MDAVLGFLESSWPWLLAVILLSLYLSSGLHFIEQWNRHPVMRFGKYVGTLQPGPQWIEPFTNRVLVGIDVRQEVLTFSMKEGTILQTHDNVPISFDTILTMQITDVEKFILNVTDGDDALEMRTLATVSEVVSRTELNSLLHERETVCTAIAASTQLRVQDWGIVIHDVAVRDVKITDESIQEAIAMKARAGKEAEAEMVRAEAQVVIAKELTLAAAQLTDGGWKLKGMEVMTEMTRSADNNTVIIPSDIVQAIAHVMSK